MDPPPASINTHLQIAKAILVRTLYFEKSFGLRDGSPGAFARSLQWSAEVQKRLPPFLLMMVDRCLDEDPTNRCVPFGGVGTDGRASGQCSGSRPSQLVTRVILSLSQSYARLTHLAPKVAYVVSDLCSHPRDALQTLVR